MKPKHLTSVVGYKKKKGINGMKERLKQCCSRLVGLSSKSWIQAHRKRAGFDGKLTKWPQRRVAPWIWQLYRKKNIYIYTKTKKWPYLLLQPEGKLAGIVQVFGVAEYERCIFAKKWASVRHCNHVIMAEKHGSVNLAEYIAILC